MIQFEERYQNNHGIWVDRLKEMNCNQVVASVDEKYQPFMKEYLLAWHRFVKEYKQDHDPVRNYTTWDIFDLREKTLYPQIKHGSVIGDLRRIDPGARELEVIMRRVDESMLHRLQGHYKQHEYGSLPPAPKIDLSPHVPVPDWKPRYNAAVLREEQVLVIGPLLLSWSVWDGCTGYEVHLADGQFIRKLEPVRNGELRRFKDPIKRHAAAIKRVQEIAALTDWSLIDALSNKQQRYLGKLVIEMGKEPLI